jgi:hypothetical protein
MHVILCSINVGYAIDRTLRWIESAGPVRDDGFDLAAGRCAVAGVMEPVEASLHEDADAGAAELAYWLGFAGGAWVVVIEIGRVHGVVEGVRAEGAGKVSASFICVDVAASMRSRRGCGPKTGTGSAGAGNHGAGVRGVQDPLGERQQGGELIAGPRRIPRLPWIRRG